MFVTAYTILASHHHQSILVMPPTTSLRTYIVRGAVLSAVVVAGSLVGGVLAYKYLSRK